MTPRLLINCDDVGMHTAANQAACHILTQGIIRSISVMAVGQAFEDARDRLRDIGWKKVGVHLVLTSEYVNLPTRPLSPSGNVASLVNPSGAFFSDTRFLSGVKAAEVRIEFSNQIERILASGFSISHLDGHMFCYEPIETSRMDLLEVVNTLAQQLKVPFRHQADTRGDRPSETIQRWNLADTIPERLHFYERLLKEPSPAALREIIIHPAHVDPHFESHTEGVHLRYADYEFFSSNFFVNSLAHRFNIVGWENVPAN